MGHSEIEKKYLIAMPDEEMLAGMDGCGIWEIEQIYLSAQPGTTRRVRKVVENGETRYYRTFKKRLSAMTAEEDEGLISREMYAQYCQEADAEKKPILKKRYRVPYEGQVLEFDIYPFWTDRAVLEIELESESQIPRIPEWTSVLKDVTEDYRYKNVALAVEVPMDEI